MLSQSPHEKIVADLICPWIPVPYIELNNEYDRNNISLSKFSPGDRAQIANYQPTSGVSQYQLRYNGWQLYTFLNDTSLIDRSFGNGHGEWIWKRVTLGLKNITDDTGSIPPGVGP